MFLVKEQVQPLISMTNDYRKIEICLEVLEPEDLIEADWGVCPLF